MAMLDHEGITMIENRKPIVYEEGWVNPKDRRGNKTPYEPTILVRHNDILKLSALLYDLHSVTPSPRSIKRTWAKVIEEYTGDVCDPDEKIQACFDQAGAISFQEGFLNYSLDELRKILQSNMRRFKGIQCNMKKANKKLRAIIDEKITNNRVKPGGQCEIKTKYIRDKKRWFKPDSESALAWITVSEMP